MLEATEPAGDMGDQPLPDLGGAKPMGELPAVDDLPALDDLPEIA
jgi:hypothetical protein